MIGWLDCGSGASGDMFLGALVDAGVPLEYLQAAVDALDGPPIRLHATAARRHGIGAMQVGVDHPASTVDSAWSGIRSALRRADLAAPVRERAIDAFERLARAEAGVHKLAVDDVRFHEVGALDSIADTVGTCAGLHWLAEHRGMAELRASVVTVGGGTTRGQHGSIPLPAPATLAVLAEAGAPVAGEVGYEACTPTGAALIAAHVTGYGPLPPMRVRAVGVGAGTRDPAERANVLRLVLGDPVAADEHPDEAVLLAANIDDLDPRLWPNVLAALLRAGAADAWLTPILMKKGRPAHTLHALCAADRVTAVRDAVFRETTTIGVRQSTVGKVALDREMSSVDVDGAPVRIKIARLGGRVVNVSVEYEDVAAAAEVLGLPAKTVLARAVAAAELTR